MYVPEHQYEIKQLLDTEGRIQYENGKPFSGTTYIEFSNGDKYDIQVSDLNRGDFSKAKKLISQIEA